MIRLVITFTVLPIYKVYFHQDQTFVDARINDQCFGWQTLVSFIMDVYT